jgi:hypothetical protein
MLKVEELTAEADNSRTEVTAIASCWQCCYQQLVPLDLHSHADNSWTAQSRQGA